MGEERSGDMNFDLNLTPGREAAGSGLSLNEGGNFDDWVDYPVERVIPALRQLERRCQRIRNRLDRQPLLGQSERLIDNPGNLNVLRPREADDVAAAGEAPEMPKMFENNNPIEKDPVSEKKGHGEIGSGDGGSFFDCNICFDMAVEPVVTCCGHLFCWPCLYLWLHKHSNSTECPVCKGDVTTSSLIPIYGRGNHKPGVSSFEIPGRPRGRRIVSLRQTYSSTRHISGGIGHHRNSWNLFPWEHLDPDREVADTGIILPRLTPSRVMQTDHSDQNRSTPPPEALNSTHNGTDPVSMEIHRFHSLISQLPADRSDPSA